MEINTISEVGEKDSTFNTMDRRRMPPTIPQNNMISQPVTGLHIGHDRLDHARVPGFGQIAQDNLKASLQKSNSMPLDSNRIDPRQSGSALKSQNSSWANNGYPNGMMHNAIMSNTHNVSQDSGLSPSPMEYSQPQSYQQYQANLANKHHQRLSLNYPHMDETGIYDNFHQS